MKFEQYRRTNIAEMRPVTPYEYEEDTLNSNISISEADRLNGSPKQGDMIARNPDNHNDMWLVAKEYAEANFIKVEG